MRPVPENVVGPKAGSMIRSHGSKCARRPAPSRRCLFARFGRAVVAGRNRVARTIGTRRFIQLIVELRIRWRRAVYRRRDPQ